MLRVLHNHIFTCRLKEMFESPLVLVYQTLGHVDHLGMQQQLQSGIAKQLRGSDVQIDLCHMKNTMAAASGNETLSRLFSNSNILVGFKLAEQQQQLQQQASPQQQQQQPPTGQELFAAATQKITRSMSPQQVIGGLLDQPMPGPHIPQPVLKALVETGVQLPAEQPLVLIGAFYKRSATPLAYLKKWIKLDQNQVYGELLGAIESPIDGLFAFEGSAEDLLACFDDAGAASIADVLDYKAATAAPDGQQDTP